MELEQSVLCAEEGISFGGRSRMSGFQDLMTTTLLVREGGSMESNFEVSSFGEQTDGDTKHLG